MRSRQRGAASLEAVFILPLLLLLIVIFFEVGRVYWHFSQFDHAIVQARRDSQKHQSESMTEMIDFFIQRLRVYQPDKMENVTIEAETFQNVDHWLSVNADSESGQVTSEQGVIVMQVELPLLPSTIPLLNADIEFYRYSKRVLLIPENKFESKS